MTKLESTSQCDVVLYKKKMEKIRGENVDQTQSWSCVKNPRPEPSPVLTPVYAIELTKA